MTQERLTALEDVAALATIGATYPELMLYLQAEMAKCEQALAAQPEQEPVAWGWRYDSCGHAVVNRLVATETSEPTLFLKNVFARGPFPLYAAPQPVQRPWVGLTEEEQLELYVKYEMDGWGLFYDAIEAALRSKNK